jgi:Flp pilus assembly protein TadD
MPSKVNRLILAAAIVLGAVYPAARGADLKLTFPRFSELTPVQRLNREGVTAIEKHQYEKAEALFYKAYLYDPADPFTLNNLGYISELQGDVDRSLRFYKLASDQGSHATIDRSNARQLEGKPMDYALKGLQDTPLQVNRMNVQAIQLLSQGQNFAADALLRKALALQPGNPFTLNNLGVAEEATGDAEGALRDYDVAAASHSLEPIVVTLKRSVRGKPLSEVAAESARQLRKQQQSVSEAVERSTMLSYRGVSATNRNDWAAAKRDFVQAYALNPGSAFSLNNLGYVAEKEGDLETAQFYYAKARKAEDAKARIGLATQGSAEGQQLSAVANHSDQDVDLRLAQYSAAQRQRTGPIELIPRGDALSTQPVAAPPASGSNGPDKQDKSPQETAPRPQP